MDELRGNEARLLKQRAEAMPRDDPRAEAFLCGWQCPFANRFPLTISPEVRLTSGEFTTALGRKMGLPVPLLLSAVGVQLSNNANSAKKVGDAYGHAYTTVTGAKGDHVRTLHDTSALVGSQWLQQAFPTRAASETRAITYSRIAFTITSCLTMTNGTFRALSPI